MSLVGIGYFNVAFCISIIVKQTKLALLLFFALVFFEIILNYLVRTHIRIDGILPMSVIRSLFTSGDKFLQLEEVSILKFLAYATWNISLVLFSWILFVKYDLPKL